MRSLSLATRQALNAQQTGEVFLFLLALTHPEMLDPLYFVNNTVDIVSNGTTYMAFPFELTIPDDSELEVTRIRLVIDNIDRRVVEAVRSINSPATFALSIIRAAEPNVLLAGPFNCRLRNVGWDAKTVSGDLWPFEDIINAQFPQHAITPGYFPGLFG